jgi:phage head maturation protease
MGREYHDEEKVTGIPAGSSIRRGGRGGSSGIPTGSSIRGGSGGGSGSGIPTGSNIKRRKRKGGGIPTGSSIRKGGSGGSRSGIPPGSKADEQEQDYEKAAWGAALNAQRGKKRVRNINKRSVSGIPNGARANMTGTSARRTPNGVPPGASLAKGRGRRRSGARGLPPGSKDDAVLVERKDAAGPVEVIDDQKGIVEAFVSVTGVKDNVDDIIEPGAYEKTLQERTPKGVWSHAWEHPVSKTLDIKELLPGDPSLPKQLADGTPWPSEAGALWVKTQFNLDSDRGREAYSMVKFFDDDGSWSIGYRVPKNGATKDAKTGVRRIKELNLYEYSPVLHGAAPLAKTRSVKSLGEAMAALEDAGYDTDGLELEEPKFDVDLDGLDPDEVKALRTAYDVVGAYLDEIDEKAVAEDVEEDEAVGWLADELADVLDPEDYAELLDFANAFDQAYAYGDDAAAEVAIDEFLDVLDAEIEADPEMAGLSELISAVLDDRYPEGEDEADDDEAEAYAEDDDFEDVEGEFEDEYEDDEAEGEYDEYDPEGEDEGDEGDYDDPDVYEDGPVGEAEEMPDSGMTEGGSDTGAVGDTGGDAGGAEGGKSLADIRWDSDEIVDSVVGSINWDGANV